MIGWESVNLKDRELSGKVHSAVYHQCQRREYATPADVLIEIGVLSKQKYEEWRFGKIPYLEQACTCNLRQLSAIIRQIRRYAEKSGLKPSFCYYKRWGVKKEQGHKSVIPLRKSGKPEIKKAYATHHLDIKKIEQLKKDTQDRNTE